MSPLFQLPCGVAPDGRRGAMQQPDGQCDARRGTSRQQVSVALRERPGSGLRGTHRGTSEEQADNSRRPEGGGAAAAVFLPSAALRERHIRRASEQQPATGGRWRRSRGPPAQRRRGLPGPRSHSWISRARKREQWIQAGCRRDEAVAYNTLQAVSRPSEHEPPSSHREATRHLSARPTKGFFAKISA